MEKSKHSRPYQKKNLFENIRYAGGYGPLPQLHTTNTGNLVVFSCYHTAYYKQHIFDQVLCCLLTIGVGSQAVKKGGQKSSIKLIRVKRGFFLIYWQKQFLKIVLEQRQRGRGIRLRVQDNKRLQSCGDFRHFDLKEVGKSVSGFKERNGIQPEEIFSWNFIEKKTNKIYQSYYIISPHADKTFFRWNTV